MSLWQRWRPWLSREKKLLIELALMALTAVVVGVYFIEHFTADLQAQQREQLQALAQQTALRAAESLDSHDLIGLNVIARETRSLATVSGVRFLDTARHTLTGKDEDAPVQVEVPVSLPDGELAGSVVLSAPAPDGAVRDLAIGYLLVVIGLLVLRVAAALVEWRLRRPLTGGADTDPPGAAKTAGAPRVRRAEPSAPPPAVPHCDLRLSVVNFEHFEQRYTRSALNALLADYRSLLAEVVALYGGTAEADLGALCRVRFQGEPLSQPAFAALCAGLLFLRVARLQGPRRKSRSAPALEFKALISSQFGEAESWALCLAGVPGRLQVPDNELIRAELDVKALYQTDQAMVVRSGEREIRLQPVAQLAQRYQMLLRTQAERVMGGVESGEGDSGEGERGEEGSAPSSR